MADNKIEKFDGEYNFLSLEYPCEITYEGIKFNNAATLLYALKSDYDLGSMRKYARLSPAKARQKAAKEINYDFEDNLSHYVYVACRAKFNSNPELKKKLKDTKDAKLINVVPYNDSRLGVYMGRGDNLLGKTLMDIRDEL